MMVGPDSTMYEGGFFTAQLDFPADFPNRPPEMRFISEMWHPNIYEDGRVCISILHPPGEDEFNSQETVRISSTHQLKFIFFFTWFHILISMRSKKSYLFFFSPHDIKLYTPSVFRLKSDGVLFLEWNKSFFQCFRCCLLRMPTLLRTSMQECNSEKTCLRSKREFARYDWFLLSYCTTPRFFFTLYIF